jgi:hypothetical protein
MEIEMTAADKPEYNADRVATLKDNAKALNDRLAAAGIPVRVAVKELHVRGWNGPEVQGYPTVTFIHPGLDPAIAEELSKLLAGAVVYGSDKPKFAFAGTEPELVSVEYAKNRQ